MSWSARPVLWPRRDAVAAVAVGLVGVALCVAAWWQASGDRAFRDELSLASLSIFGLALVFGAEATWILRGRAAVGRRARLILGSARPLDRDLPSPLAPAPSWSVPGFVAGAGLRRYHWPDCSLIAGVQPLVSGSSREHLSAGRRPCGICRPDEASGGGA